MPRGYKLTVLLSSLVLTSLCSLSTSLYGSWCSSFFSKEKIPFLDITQPELFSIQKLPTPFDRIKKYSSLTRKQTLVFTNDISNHQVMIDVMYLKSFSLIFLDSIKNHSFLNSYNVSSSILFSLIQKLQIYSKSTNINLLFSELIQNIILPYFIPQFLSKEPIQSDILEAFITELSSKISFLRSFDQKEKKIIVQVLTYMSKYNLDNISIISVPADVLSVNQLLLPTTRLSQILDNPIIAFLFHQKFLNIKQKDSPHVDEIDYYYKYNNNNNNNNNSDKNTNTDINNTNNFTSNSNSFDFILLESNSFLPVGEFVQTQKHLLDILYPPSLSTIPLQLISKLSSGMKFTVGACSAVVVSSNTVLTAAHCLERALMVEVIINGKAFYAQATYPHPEFDSQYKDPTHDIGIIRFPDGTFSDISPVRISLRKLQDVRHDKTLVFSSVQGLTNLKKISILSTLNLPRFHSFCPQLNEEIYELESLRKKIDRLTQDKKTDSSEFFDLCYELDFYRSLIDYKQDFPINQSRFLSVKKPPFKEVLNIGDSGGGLFDKNSNLVGIISSIGTYQKLLFFSDKTYAASSIEENLDFLTFIINHIDSKVKIEGL